MRSIHKKTLKRFLSTLLALTMVLGMVPFTALAAPANGYNLTVDAPDQVAVNQVVDGSSTLTGLTGASGYTAYVTIAVTGPTGANPKILATDTTSGIEYNLAETGVWGDPTTGFAVAAGHSATTPLKLKFDVPGSYTATFKLINKADSTEICSGTKTITVVGFNSLTANPTAPQPGESFEVTASTTATSGVVQFSYGSQTRTAAVTSGSVATATFTAEAGQTAVVAVLSGISGVDAVTTSATLGTPATMHTITFDGNAVDAYHIPDPVSVAHNSTYDGSGPRPDRTGYTFAGWATTSDAAAPNVTDTTPLTVDGDKTLYAIWAEETVAITWPTSTITGVTPVGSTPVTAVKGSTVRFALTLAESYDPATLTVTANGVPLAPVKDASNKYWYQFTATENTTVDIAQPSLKTFVVALPTGDNFNAVFTGTGDGNKTSVVKKYDDTYSFKVEPVGNYKVKAVYVNGTAVNATGDVYGSFTVKGPQTISIVMEAVQFCTVTYVVDGVQMTTRQVQKDTLVKDIADLAIPTKEGYTPTAWYTDNTYSTLVSDAEDTVKVTSDMEVYAKYDPKTYWIKYDLNTANGPAAPDPGTIGDTKKTFGQAVALSAVVPTATNYVFKGWAASADGPAVYQPGDTYSAESTANGSGVYQNVTLYAVWEIKTYHVTLVPGAGVTAYAADYEVAYGSDFDFIVIVERDYAATLPTVTVTPAGYTANKTGSPSSDSEATYTCKVNSVKNNLTITITATHNQKWAVNFKYALFESDGTAITTSPNGVIFDSQTVEHGYYAVSPVIPVLDGYTFEGWYKDTACTTGNEFGFASEQIISTTDVYAKMTAIEPKVELPADATANGWWISFGDTSNADTNAEIATVDYKDEKTFYIFVANGYDATNMQVSANGYKLAPITDATDVTDGSGNSIGKRYTFKLYNITEDQKITVTGVVRKTVTITYNDNGGIGGPGQEQVKYYLSDTDCGEISTVKPTRVGYEFLGWATTNNATAPAYSNPAKTTPVTSKIANFTTDTTLYAVWSAKTTTVTLTVDKTFQYEGENVTLTATVTSGTGSDEVSVTSGSVQFYRANNSSAAELVGTAKVSGGKAVLTIATSAYKRGAANTDSYTVKFIPDEGSGYSEATSSPAVTVTVLSTAISWKLSGNNIDTDGNKLTIYTADADGNKTSTTTDTMTAGQIYYLELPAIYALDEQTTKLTVNKDYTVTWQFCNASGTWEDYTAAAGTDSVKILAAYSKYVFRAVVTPLTGATGHFTQAAKYNGTALTADAYEAYLVTEATSPVAQQQTTTTLTVTDRNDIPVTGGTDIVAEFEGQKVTLTATVTLSGSTTKVTTGEVYFYKNYNPSTKTGTLIGKADVQSDGTATLEAEMSTYSYLLSDRFTAVYQDNATYKTSTSNEELVRIRSTAIAWAKDTSGAEVKTLTVTPTDSIYADNQYTLTLPAIVEDGQPNVTLTVGTDYVVSWYMVKADKTVVLLAENTESNTYTVVPPTAGVTYYAVVSPKAGSNYTDAYEDSTTKNFLTSAETAASVKAPTVTTITFGEVLTDTGKTPDFSQYEEKTITITAKVVEADLTNTTTAKTPEEVVKSGTVTFYVVTTNGTNVVIGTAAVDNSGQATVDYTLPEFSLATTETLDNIEYFFAMYTDTVGTYADSNTTTEASSTITAPLTYDFGVGTDTKIDKETEAVQILSTSISWKLDGDNKIVAASATTTDANKLKVYAGDTTAASALVSDGKMTAGSTYTLELPAVYALDDAKSTTPTALTVNVDYTVVWQYREFGASDWNNYPIEGVGNTVLITPTYSGYQFQAVVTPIYDNEHLTGYKTAAAYDSSDVATGKTKSLITDPTEKTERQATTTDLEITGADNEGTVTIAGTSVTTGLAQFEGQKVTLKATVTDNSTSKGVLSGYVKFYRYVDGTGTGDELLNTTQVAVDEHGIATFDVTIKDYTDADDNNATEVLNNVDKFYAVYEENATYATSSSVADPDKVYIKSTAIKTPVVDSTLSGKRGSVDNATSTSYTEDLTDLLAGVEHTFTLRTGNAAADWSVVALDGRTVASTDYTIQWLVTTGTNEEKAANNETAATFVVNESKNGDKYRVKLVPTADGDMKTGATSNYVVINSLQNVTVLVTASDEIKSTPATDVYQLNNITLTAEVQGKDSHIMLPTGNVTFYYSVDNTNWVEIGTAALALDNVSGTMKATFVTDQLPVDVVNGYKQEEVTITAVYAGDETFEKSGEFETATKTITDTVAGAVTDEIVTVYSSVVLVHAAEENTAVTSLTDGGIHITANGSLVANETDVALTLQQVYTLDYGIDLSKLVYGTDYTVQWQILDNPSLYNDGNGYYGNTEKWNDIGATGSSYTIGTVPQDAAYRAEITVTNTAPVQGSAQGVLQGAANATTNGRQVYYSNVLVVGAGQATVTTNITTSANTKFNEEGIVAGETVTIHALVAGASNVTPISNLTVTILPQGVTDPALAVFTDELTTVNGYNAFTWDTTGVTPGYYTLKVTATSNNGYAPQKIERTLIVRDNIYKLEATKESKVYNGKAQGIDWSLTDIDIEDELAQKSVVVYYYQDGKMVEPTQVGTYNYELYLPASAYWTETDVSEKEGIQHITGTFTIEKRTVNVVDLVAQAKVYDGTTDINELEVILNDSTVDGDGVATGNNGIINGDSIYATGVMAIDAAGVGTRTLSVSNVTLHGDDANNYTVGSTNHTETINVQRSQVKGDIADSTFQYTGSNITVPADDIYLIDQAGNVLTPADYTVTYYYHNGDGVEKVTAMNKLGKYTVIARPEQNNYKGGASQTVYVVSGTGTDADPTTYTSALINITNTVELYGAVGNTGIVATATNGATTTVNYNVSGSWTTTVPSDAGRYLVKVTASTDDTAYGIYTIVKARPEFVPTTDAAEVTYNSAPYGETVDAGFKSGKSDDTAETYVTYTGGTIQGIAYEAPTEVGKYIATVHVGETDNYTAHEEQVAFEIKPKALTITADDLARWQYGSYPDMVATFEGLATGGVAADTSLRDVQIQPEFIFNDLNGDGQPEYTNSALDQVGRDYLITVRNALARNYTVTYVAGSYAVNELDPKADLAIHGMIDNGITNPAPVNIAYYGDQIQLYAYGNYKSNGDGTGVYNPSSLLEWEVDNAGIASITQDGLLTITGVGTFNVILTRGSGTAAISTSIKIKAEKQEIKIIVPDEDVVYSATPKSYTKGNISAVNGKLETITDPVTSKVAFTNDSRTNVGSQIVNAVVSGASKYQSETYGGLFTINDKEATVTPGAQTTVYGTAETYDATEYTVTGKEGSVDPVTGVNVASVADAYANLDVLDGYEILVAGVENKNYNVKYITDVTDGSTPDAQVTAKPLTVSTGTLDDNIALTSGSLNPQGDYPVNGAVVDPAVALSGKNNNVRMYGEPNWVMDYDVWTAPDKLIAGDSLADLDLDLEGAPLGSTLVDFSYNIAGHASVTYLDHSAAINASQYPGYTIPAANQQVVTGDTMMDLVNYTESYALGTQNIYQRPVKLVCNVTETELPKSTSAAALNDILIQNITADKLSGVGGLATLLKHTVANLDLKITYEVSVDGTTWTTVSDFTTLAGYTKVRATISVGNPDYYAEPITVVFDVTPTRYVIEIVSFGQSSASVNLYEYNEDTGTKTLTWFPADSALAAGSASTAMTCKIYNRVNGLSKYADYAYETPVVDAKMIKGYTTGRYTISYSALVGSFRMFAIADGYIIIDNT